MQITIILVSFQNQPTTPTYLTRFQRLIFVLVGNYKPVVAEIKLLMDKYVERRKRRKTILQRKTQRSATNGNN